MPTYYRPSGFTRAIIQTVAADAIVETEFALPQKASMDAQNTEITWEGGDQKITQRQLDGMTVQLDLDAVSTGAHEAIFDKDPITGTIPGGMTNVRGYGGGNDKRGVACGLRLEGPAIKNVDGVLTSVTFARWFPQGTLTLLKPGEFQTSAKLGLTSYSFTPIRTAVDILGDEIAGAPDDGDFFYEGEV